MYTLGIETSCDETACAVLKNGRRILSNVISSSLARHKPFGGVVPEIASRHCLEVIDLVYKRALREAGLKDSQIDLIAVTRGPGLIGSLFVGISFAKALSFALGVPFVTVNHIEAHLEANFLGAARKPSEYIGLIVSGGHTAIVQYSNCRYRLLGQTVDDAIGEAYDKTAKILGLGYPGGPVIDRLSKGGDPNAFFFTKPRQDKPLDFSFSGIKTAVLRLYEREAPVQTPPHPDPLPLSAENRTDASSGAKGARGSMPSPLPRSPLRQRTDASSGAKAVGESVRTNPPRLLADGAEGEGRVRVGERLRSGKRLKDLCASFQEAVIRWTVEKTLLACERKKIWSVAVGGGVSANSRLRELLEREAKARRIRLFLPPRELTTDNAVMVARLGEVLYRHGKRSDFKAAADPSLSIGKN